MWLDQKIPPDTFFNVAVMKFLARKKKRGSIVSDPVDSSGERVDMMKSKSAPNPFVSIPADTFMEEKVEKPRTTVHMSLFPRKYEKEPLVEKPRTAVHMSLFPRKYEKKEPLQLGASLRSILNKSPTPPKETIENVTLALAIPTRTTSTVPLSELFDSSINDVVPSFFQNLENEIMEMIKGDDDIHPKLKNSLKLCVLNSRYSIAYVDFGQEILCTKQNAGFYYRRCLSRNETPSLLVRFPAQVMSAAA